MTRRRHIGETEQADIFYRADGRCHWCGEKIRGGWEDWHIDHVVALELGGDDAKGSNNLQPIHVPCHRIKTVQDVKHIAKSKRQQRRGKGIKRQPRRKIPGSKGTGFKVRLTSDGPKVERRE